MTINDYVRKLTPEETVDAFGVVLAELNDESLEVAVGELSLEERDRLREALDAVERGEEGA